MLGANPHEHVLSHLRAGRDARSSDESHRRMGGDHLPRLATYRCSEYVTLSTSELLERPSYTPSVNRVTL